MEERLSMRRETGIDRAKMRLWGLIIIALGLLSRGILQTRVLGMNTNSGAQLLELLNMEGGMAAATAALVLQALESCAVPIFAVLTLEGFEKTSSFRKYLLRMLGTALISELPYNFAVYGKLLEVSSRNPVFGLVLTLVMLYLYRYYAGKSLKNLGIKLAVFAAALLWAVMLRVQYGASMLVIVTVLWMFRERRTLRFFLGASAALVCSVGSPLFLLAPFGFLLVHCYNGEEGNSVKVLQYLLYPILLLTIGLIGLMMF